MFFNKSIAIFLLLIVGGCQKDSLQLIPKRKAILVYMIADNNLDHYAIHNINQMESAYNNKIHGDLYVYLDRAKGKSPSHPYLLKIENDTTPFILSKIIRTYPEQNSCDANILKAIVGDVMKICNKNTSLEGLVLWSHGNGWLPANADIITERNISPRKHNRSFGLDEDKNNYSESKDEMDICKLATVLQDWHFKFIIFDACFMGSIEVAYELKSSFEYIIASPTEILSVGFPYKEMLNTLYLKEFNPSLVVRDFIAYYQSQTGIMKSGAISAINTSELPVLANYIKKSIPLVPLSNPSIYFQYDRNKLNCFFDLDDFLKKNVSIDQYNAMKPMIEKIIISYKHTDEFMESINLKETCGLSMYIPHSLNQRKDIHEYYCKTKWGQDSGLASFWFNN